MRTFYNRRADFSHDVLYKVFSLSPPVGSVWLNVLRGPLEVLGGAVAGVALGYFLHYFPSRDQVSALRPFELNTNIYVLFHVFHFNMFNSQCFVFCFNAPHRVTCC